MDIQKFSLLSPELQSRYTKEIGSTDWDAAQYLAERLTLSTIQKDFGAKAELLLLIEEGDLLAFCTYAEQDEIDDPSLTPWIGFVYTFPDHRGHRYSEKLVDYAKKIARSQHYSRIYVSSEEVGLYEKYGFRFMRREQSIHDYETQIFVCDL